MLNPQEIRVFKEDQAIRRRVVCPCCGDCFAPASHGVDRELESRISLCHVPLIEVSACQRKPIFPFQGTCIKISLEMRKLQIFSKVRGISPVQHVAQRFTIRFASVLMDGNAERSTESGLSMVYMVPGKFPILT